MPAPIRRIAPVAGALLVAALLVGLYLAGSGGASNGSPGSANGRTVGTSAASSTPGRTPTARATTPAAVGTSGLKTVRPAELPPEARTTLALIAKGGPYPYSRDGVVFENREGLLPRKPAGYYHEYTVVTPGSDDRGARRVIAGKSGELFYTDDHYVSFREVIGP